jgi:hypothetical protein
VQPYPEFELNDITRDMGYAVDHYDDFPSQFNRAASIQVDDKRAIENLHKWFPILVRNPGLIPLAKRTLHSRLWSKPLLAAYALYSEWLVTEQNVLYRRAQGITGPSTWGPLDFSLRVLTKSAVRAVSAVGGNVVQRMSAKLAMNDERVAAHMD